MDTLKSNNCTLKMPCDDTNLSIQKFRDFNKYSTKISSSMIFKGFLIQEDCFTKYAIHSLFSRLFALFLTIFTQTLTIFILQLSYANRLLR